MNPAPWDAAGNARRALLAAVGAAAALACVAGAGWWGYRSQIAAWPAPTRGPSASVPGAALASPAADTSVQPASGYRAKPQGTASARPLAAAAGAAPAPLAWPMWEFLLRQPMAPRNPPLTPVPWRLIGASQSGSVWSIIVMRQGKTTPEYFKTGESLPGGYRIESITEEDVTLVKGKLPVILSYIGSR